MKEAREGWTKLCESLRKYELLVEQTRREAGELIPKVDMQAWIEIFYFWFTMSLREQAQSLATALSGATETVICETIGGTLADACFNTALVYLAKGGDSRMVETTRQFIAKNQRLTGGINSAERRHLGSAGIHGIQGRRRSPCSNRVAPDFGIAR
jgi:serine/threonine protein phosphatase PrpC